MISLQTSVVVVVVVVVMVNNLRMVYGSWRVYDRCVIEQIRNIDGVLQVLVITKIKYLLF